jgi:ubiquinone/menaquinone biosynthesis C-methylase UbiE
VKIENWIEANLATVDSHQLFREWVEMHSTHNYWRDEQASIIIRILQSIDEKNPTVVDLGCGAGDLSEHLLKSLPNVRIVGIDHNPFLLMIYRSHLSEYRDRFSLILGDIEKDDTIKSAGRVQAAVALSFFHNLSRQSLLRVCHSLYEFLPNDGIFASADVSALSDGWFEDIHYSEKVMKPAVSIMDYWQTIKERYGIAEEIDEMLKLTSTKDIPEHGYPPSFYVNSLRWAGFKIADVVFQAGNRIVYCGKKA